MDDRRSGVTVQESPTQSDKSHPILPRYFPKQVTTVFCISADLSDPDQKMCRCDILERSGRSCVERVTEGQSLFAFSVMSSLTVKGRKGLNRTGQTD